MKSFTCLNLYNFNSQRWFYTLIRRDHLHEKKNATSKFTDQSEGMFVKDRFVCSISVLRWFGPSYVMFPY